MPDVSSITEPVFKPPAHPPTDLGEDPCGYRHLDHANDLEPSDGHRWLREHCPVHVEADGERPFLVLSRHDDILAVLKEPDLWGNRDGSGVFHKGDGVLGTTDNPHHDRHRRVLRRLFLPTVIARMEPTVAAVVDDLMARFVPAGEGDFAVDYAFTMPALVIGELLGVDPADRNDFRVWSAAVVEAIGGGDVEAYHEARASIMRYIDARVDVRAEMLGRIELAPDDDPIGTDLPEDAISVMYVAHLRGELAREEIAKIGHQLLVAGHETTTGLMGLMMWRFCQRPELLDQMRADRALIDVAVEEGLRYDAPAQGLFRTNIEPTTLGGREIPERAKLQLLFASANRDPGGTLGRPGHLPPRP